MTTSNDTALRFGAVFAPHRDITELAAFAGELERDGFDELWVVEDCFLHGGLVAAATALASTRRLAVGCGLLPAAVRNPAIVAMELATLARLHPGRFRAAFGHGVEAWMRQIDARPPDRVAALSEVVEAVGALLDGEHVTRDGRFVTLRDVALEPAPAQRPQLLIGTTGPRGVATAAEVADGLLLPEGSSRPAVARAREQLGEGKELVVYAWLRIDDDGDRARADLREAVSAWRAQGLYPGLQRLAGIPDEGEIPAEALDAIAITGTPEECARSVRAFAEAGATTLVLAPIGADPQEDLSRFAGEVLSAVSS